MTENLTAAEGRFAFADELGNFLRFPTLSETRRIAAAYNACAGIPTEALEARVVGELVEALDWLIYRAHKSLCSDDLRNKTDLGKAIDRAREALAKLKGETA